MNSKRNLTNMMKRLMKFSVRRAVILMLLLPTVGSLIILSSFYFYLNQTKDDILFTNVAGRQRMLSEQLDAYAHMVYDMGQEEDREPLRKLVANFDNSLTVLDQGGEVMGRRLSPPPAEIKDEIDVVKQLWQDLKPALLLVADQPTTSTQAVKANNFVKVNIPRLRYLSNEVVFSFELQSHNQKERILWILITILSLNFVLLLTGIVVIKRYLTERKQAEETLRKSEKKYSAMFELASDAVLTVLPPDGKIIDANEAAIRMLGYLKEELRKLSGRDIIAPEVFEETERKWQRQSEENGDILLETIWVRKDGSRFPIEVSGKLFMLGDQALFQLIGRDITKRRQAEEEVKKLSKVVEQSPDAAFITDPNGKIEYVNPAFEEITGYSSKEALGKNSNILKSGEMSKKYHKQMWDTILSGKSFHAEVIDRKKNGELFIYDQTITPLKDADGDIINFISTGRDVTERVESRKKLEQALEKAERADRVKTLFLANISHEIRTPLNAILGFTDLIKMSTHHLLSPEEQTFFDTVSQSGERLLHTVHEILDISQIEAGAFKFKKSQLNLVELLENAIREQSSAAKQKGLKLTFHSKVKNPVVEMDGYTVMQAISNLIENAIKYTEQGQVKVSLENKDGKLELTIKDTGIGISYEYLDKMFEPFSQESEGYTKRFQGIGLGLALTKRYLDMNNIPINVKSIKGKGTVLTLTFQSSKKCISKKVVRLKEEPEIKVSKEPGDKPLVLLVEDDMISQNLVKYFTKGLYNLIFTESVQEAKECIRKHMVELVLLDLSLVDNEDGLDFARYLRKTKKWRDVPIIALTAHAFVTDRENSLKAGCNDYLAKPVGKRELLTKMEKYIKDKSVKK